MSWQAKDYGNTTYVTGMRAWASVAVVLVHAGGAGLRSLGTAGSLLADMGPAGVFVFFVISGFSVAASYASAGGFGRYLFLRYMRLAPLFYVWMLVYWAVLGRTGFWAQSFGLYPPLTDAALHLLFLHGFSVSSANSILGVEWSLSVEMFWYLSLPLLLAVAKRGWGAVSVVVGLLWYVLLHALLFKEARALALAEEFLTWHPLLYLFSFALGVWAYTLRARASKSEASQGVMLAAALGVAYWSVSCALGRLALDLTLASSVLCFFFLVFGSSDDRFCRALFMSPVALFFGTLSYGLYLSHLFAVQLLQPYAGVSAGAQLLFFAAVLALSALFAWIGYRAVELPGQAWSKRFWPL